MKKYTLSIGLRDGKLAGHPQIIPTAIARRIVENAMLQRFGGATIQTARGIYTHENGRAVREITLVCYIYGAEEQAVKQAAQELARRLRQESIAYECTEIDSDFIGGGL